MTWLPATPAFLGFRPPELVWQSQTLRNLTQNHQAWWFFSQKHPQIDSIQKLETHHIEPFGFYRVQGHQYGEAFDWFVKLVTPEQAERHQAARSIAEFVREQGIMTPQEIEGFPLPLTDEVVALASPYWAGRFYEDSVADLAEIGHTLGKLHNALRAYPASNTVKQAGLQRQQMLLTQWQSLLDDEKRMAVLPEAVQAILSEHSPSWLNHLLDGAQMVHGDVNVGNLWFVEDKHLAVLDWEDSLSAWFDPLKDVAFVIERFILTVHEPEQFMPMANTLLEAYFAQNRLAVSSSRRLADLLQGLAIRACLLLTHLVEQESSSKINCESEWQKFVFLYKLSQQHQAELEAMIQPYVAASQN